MAENRDSVTRPAGPGSTAMPGVAPADNPQLADERASALEAYAQDTAADRPFTSEQLMPTCMIVMMFVVLAAFALPVIIWVLGPGLAQGLPDLFP